METKAKRNVVTFKTLREKLREKTKEVTDEFMKNKNEEEFMKKYEEIERINLMICEIKDYFEL